MTQADPTYVGSVEAVSGSIVSVRIRDALRSSLLMVGGESYRIGQIGAFLRIPLGYAQLYGVCTQVGAAAIPDGVAVEGNAGQRWLSICLFGESLGGQFERGVSQYPTVGEEVHLVTTVDLEIIYSSLRTDASILVGGLAASSGIEARLDLARIVTRHCAIVGSTGSGKSNLVAVLLEAIATQGFPAARVLVVDPHGEYGTAVGELGYVFTAAPQRPEEKLLRVPFWALPFDELVDICMGSVTTGNAGIIREAVTSRKIKASTRLATPPRQEKITADSPIPFSIRDLWFKLDDFERVTFKSKGPDVVEDLVTVGDATSLMPNKYPTASTSNSRPFKGPRRGLTRQLEFMRNRLQDPQYEFLFADGESLSPDLEGNVTADIDSLVSRWVGHDRPITVLDVSGLPSELVGAIVGTMLRLVYDVLYWANDLAMSGKNQPLLVVLEEAHLFLPEGQDTAAHRVATKIAKEGRKYGIGLALVTQRPTEIESTALSQCGTVISLRLTNSSDRGKVTAAMPDDLGNLAAMLPALRTGEGLVIGEAMPIPSRIQFRRAANKPVGDDPDIGTAWRGERPDPKEYAEAVARWRGQTR